MAVMSKAGCNMGACHGNANGKASFKLSLRGQDPDLDLLALTHDQFARRVNPLEPDQSLLLLKATAALAHEGGQRFKKDSDEYQMVRRWIADGMRDDLATAPKLTKIEVTPREQIVVEPAGKVQLKAKATFSDGSKRDITKIAVYEPANTLVKVSADGLVTRDRFGECTVLVRYLDQQLPVRLAFVPARPDFKWQELTLNNYVDENIFTKLRSLRTNPSPLCNDETFQRRAFLDLLGILPTADEARAFLKDQRPNKRALLVDKLLTRPEFADYWALKWSDLLKVEEHQLDATGVAKFHGWIRQSIADNKPLNLFASELIASRGSTYSNAPANYYRASRDPISRAEGTAQLFLGTRLNCAQCHNHPFDRWSQDDYYNWAGLFARVDYKILENKPGDKIDKHEFKGEQVVFIAKTGEVKNPRTGKAASPKFLGAEKPKVTDHHDELQALADWIASPKNPFFARTQVNRIWFHLLGRGLVDPVDDFRATNPATHPALLEALAQDFVEHKFDLQYLIRTIMNSRAYQLSSEPNATNADDELNYSHNTIRRLTAEQLIDCQAQVAGVPLKLNGLPEMQRVAQLPGALPQKRRSEVSVGIEQFLKVFGKPQRLLTSECERSNETTLGQAFQLVSGPTVNELITSPNNRLAKLLASGKANHEVIEELYWTALTRAPAASELQKAYAHLDAAKDRRSGLEDLLWSLLNAKEFILRK